MPPGASSPRCARAPPNYSDRPQDPSVGPGRAKLLLSPICSLLPPEPTGNPPPRCRASRGPLDHTPSALRPPPGLQISHSEKFDNPHGQKELRLCLSLLFTMPPAPSLTAPSSVRS